MVMMDVIGEMSESEARQNTDQIKYHLNEAGLLLLRMQTLEGWRVLGYQSFTQYLSYEFTQSRSRLYQLMRSAPVQERLREEGYDVNPEQALALAKYPEDKQLIIYETVVNKGKPVTAERITAQGDVYTEMAATGGLVTRPDGSQSSAESAYNAQREQQEIAKHESFVLLETSAVISQLQRFETGDEIGDYVFLRIGLGESKKLNAGAKVKITITEFPTH